MYTKIELEFWDNISYSDIKPNMYRISTFGRIINRKTGREIFGNLPDNEKGYVRVALQTETGKVRKFALHRLVLGAFTYFDKSKEVNHIDGNKQNNYLTNLEYATRKENAEHAAKHGLYSSGDKHFKAVLTNEMVHQICRYMEKGYANIEIAKIMGMMNMDYDNLLTSIRIGRSWKGISYRYNIPKGPVYKKYTKDDIIQMCKYLFIDRIPISIIITLYPQYESKKLKNVLKKINQGKLYRSIANDVKSSTTRERL